MPLTEDNLANFYGTQGYHRWSALFPKMLLTDGAKYVADNGGSNGAYWLMDAIASYQPRLLKNESLQDFQLWTLKVKDGSGVLTCQEDCDVKPCVTQKFEYTDFDLPEIQFYVERADANRWVILLRSEH